MKKFGKLFDETRFREVVASSLCATDAAKELGIGYSTYKRIAKKLGCFMRGRNGSYKKVKESIEKLKSGGYVGKDIGGSRLIFYLVSSGIKIYRCENCGIETWQGKKIILHAHHKDGNHYNNSIDNIELLCPNCHSQTDSFGFHNKVRYDKTTHAIMPVKQDPARIRAGRYISRCPKCGRERELSHRPTSDSVICRSCRIIEQRKHDRPDKFELMNAVQNSHYSDVGQKYGVTRTTVKKWCLQYGIKIPKRLPNSLREG